MALPPLLRERSVAARFVLLIVAPLAFGALCGYVLGSSETGFNLLMLLAGVGGVLSGFDHLGPRAGAGRGLVGGVLFSGALFACFTVRGAAIAAHLPLALHNMVLLYAATGVPLGALGGRLRARAEARRAAAAAAAG